ncbi:MAG: hypothetical protein ABEJ36_02345 [Candidatus Nanosalina sp.]
MSRIKNFKKKAKKKAKQKAWRTGKKLGKSYLEYRAVTGALKYARKKLRGSRSSGKKE